jgi:hypothetical protein
VSPGLDWRRLRDTARLMRRRAQAGRPWLMRPAGLTAVAALAALLVVSAASAAAARGLWLAALWGATALVVAGAPFRMFWRPDAGFLGRLPIPGRELYRLEAWRALDAAAPLAAVLAVAALGLGGDALTRARHVAYAAALLAAAAALAPAAGALAGALAASERGQALVGGVTGQSVPPTSWLSIVPGGGAVALVWAGIAGQPWPANGSASAVLPLGAALVASAAALLAATPLASATLAAATRAVAALDAVKLAHVDRVGPRGLERALGRLLAAPARLVFAKDITLQRRRHPGTYLLIGLGVLGAWTAAFTTAPTTRETIALVAAGALAAYSLLFAHRLALPPVELPRLLATLPIAPADAAAAKRLAVAERALMATIVLGAPAVWRAPAPLAPALALAALGVVTVVVGARLARAR